MKLVFVYNANGGLLAGMLDSVHKTLSPETYACALCAITHGTFTMDRGWRAYLKELRLPVVFYHRPDFRDAWPDYADWPLPLIALQRGDKLEPLIDAPTLHGVAGVDQLVAMLSARLANSGARQD